MAEHGSIDPNSVKKAIDVEVGQEIAWRVFTEKMGTWWPLAYYKIGKANAVDAREPASVKTRSCTGQQRRKQSNGSR